jgi:hypothetical protein
LQLFRVRFAAARPSRRRSRTQHRSGVQDRRGLTPKRRLGRRVATTYRWYFCGSTRFSMEQLLALVRTVMCIVSITRPEPRVHQPDPPGLIHDDPRLLPPWRGSSLFWGKFSAAVRWLPPPVARCGNLSAGCWVSAGPTNLCTLASLSTNPALALVSQGHGPARWVGDQHHRHRRGGFLRRVGGVDGPGIA